jgi:hypothetical protein
MLVCIFEMTRGVTMRANRTKLERGVERRWNKGREGKKPFGCSCRMKV